MFRETNGLQSSCCTILVKLVRGCSSMWLNRHRVNTLFWHAVTSILSQRLLHKITEFWLLVFTLVKRQNVAKKLNAYPPSILSDTFAQLMLREMHLKIHLSQHKLCSRKMELHWNYISTLTGLHVRGDERWGMEEIRISVVSLWIDVSPSGDPWRRLTQLYQLFTPEIFATCSLLHIPTFIISDPEPKKTAKKLKVGVWNICKGLFRPFMSLGTLDNEGCELVRSKTVLLSRATQHRN